MKPILQYQEGGDIKSLFVDYQPFQGLNRTAKNTPQRATSSSEGGEKSSSKVGLKDLLGLVKELKGLPVDNNIVVQQIQSMYEDAALFNNGEMSTNELVSTYLSALRSIRMAEFNQQEFNDARKQVVANGGLNEFAIDLHGNIYIQDQETGEIKNVTPEQYNKIKDNDNYQALTNSNLLYYRANDPNFAFKNDILNIVSNGIGMKQITEQLLAVSSKIGTSTLKQQGYSEKNAQGIVQGMASLEKAFQQGMTIEGLYHQGIITKDQSEQAKLALTYLWNTLPENARALLKVKGGSTKGAFELIQSLVFSGLDSDVEYSSDLIRNPNSKSGSNSSSEGEGSEEGGANYGKDDKSNPYFNMVKQIGGTVTPVIIRKGNIQISLDGTNYSSLPDLSGKPIESTSVDDLLNRGLAGIVTDRNAITFGNQVLNSSDLVNIMYDNSGGTMMILPCKKTADGRTVVDMSIMDEYEDAINDIKKLNNPTDEQIAEIYVRHGLMQLVDQSTGLPNRSRFAQFLVIDAYGVNKNDFLNDSEFLQEVKDPDDELVQRIVSSLSTNDKKNDYKIDLKDSFFGTGLFEGNYDEIYRGVAYIPITINELQSITAFDKHAKNFYQRESDYQMMMKRINAGSTNPNVL